MRKDTRRNKTERSGKGARKSGTAGREIPEGTTPQYTALEREKMQMGLRILARMIARAHLRREASGDAAAPPQDRGAGD